MFDKSHCAECETSACMMKCQWIDFESKEAAKKEIMKLINEDKDCRILTECMLCFACDEYCTYNSHPFDLINALQEKYNSQNVLPAIAENSIKMYAAKGVFRPIEIDPTKPNLFPRISIVLRGSQSPESVFHCQSSCSSAFILRSKSSEFNKSKSLIITCNRSKFESLQMNPD